MVIVFIRVNNFNESNRKINDVYILMPKAIKQKAPKTKQLIIKKKQGYDKLNPYID